MSDLAAVSSMAEMPERTENLSPALTARSAAADALVRTTVEDLNSSAICSIFSTDERAATALTSNRSGYALQTDKTELPTLPVQPMTKSLALIGE